ncbi:hypothetical protein LCL89_09555 [Halobacillus yeomjeoni]|uniref:hypothetical protein n=1 Tax=Halobacillus yeomjeoni TaxID=311194 RepID=UPI001CD81A64|nr:hypothetical protein [Halobacillus yeomjeoni]MCA0984290.1 hypothetical protein [Halobacillus yeomjeoni]
MKKIIIAILLAGVFTFLSAAFDGRLIETQQERIEVEGLTLGYPFPYIKQAESMREPPLPAFFGLELRKVRSIDEVAMTLNFMFYLSMLSLMYLLLKIIRRYKSLSQN